MSKKSKSMSDAQRAAAEKKRGRPPRTGRLANAKRGDPHEAVARLETRGKPRRASGIAKQRCIRVDDDSYRIAINEFGSAGNALYYLAEGVRTFRKDKGLNAPREAMNLAGEPRQITTITRLEASRIIDWLEDYVIEALIEGHEMRKINRVIEKLWQCAKVKEPR